MKLNLSIATALAMSLLVAPACDKEKKKEGGENAKTAEKGGDSKTAPGTGSSDSGGTTAADMMAHFPADTEIVLNFNMASLTGSSMWKQYGEAAMKDAAKDLEEFKETCGFDPITTLKSMHVGINSTNSEEPVLLVSGFARATIMDCAKKMAEKEGKKLDISEDGNFTIIKSDSDTTALGWLNDSTLIVVPKKSDKAYLQARIDGKDGLKGNAGFGTAAGKANQGAPIWFAGSFADGSPASSGMGMGAPPKGFFGSIGFSDGIDFDLGVTFADAAAAEETLNMAKGMLPMAKGPLGPAGDILDKVQLATKGADMTIGLKLTDADVEKLKGAAGGMLGGMGGL